MRTVLPGVLVALAVLLGPAVRGWAEDKAPAVYPTALLPFEERGANVKDLGPKVTDLLFVKLATQPNLVLVDRADLKKILDEQELNLSGAVKADQATRVGQLTGAKLLVSGSVLQVDRKLYLVAKVMGTETGRVLAASTDGKATDELGPLVEKLGDKLAEMVDKQAGRIVAQPAPRTDRIEALAKRLKPGHRPRVFVQIRERHVGQATIDPAAETEFTLYCKATGFEALDPAEGLRAKADLVITGEGISEFAARHGNLISVKARVEVKVVDRKTDKIVAVDRQTAVVVDLTEQLAGKAALQQAAAALAERLLPQLIPE